jgi:hypothetical protein
LIKNGVCRVTIGSVTYATKAQRSLAKAAIYAEMVKLDSGNSGRGCTYGLEFPCTQWDNVRAVLQSIGIKTRDLIRL